MYIWEKEMHSVGILKIDIEHQQLFHIINDVYEAIINNNREDLNILLLKMLIHVYKDNKTENDYMLLLAENTNDINIKNDIEEHIKEHDRFINMIISYIELYIYQKKPMLGNIAVILNDWVNNHIIERDVKIMKYIV